MNNTLKKILTGTLAILPIIGFVFGGAVVENSFRNNPVFAVENERSQTFMLSNLSGTLPTSTTYVDINATSNPCGFVFTGNAQRAGTSPNFLLAITNDRTPEAKIVITVPSYVISLTAVELTAYSASTKTRYLAINGSADDTAITSTGTYANPINIGKINVTGSSVTITSPNGNIMIKEFILYFI